MADMADMADMALALNFPLGKLGGTQACLKISQVRVLSTPQRLGRKPAAGKDEQVAANRPIYRMVVGVGAGHPGNG